MIKKWYDKDLPWSCPDTWRRRTLWSRKVININCTKVDANIDGLNTDDDDDDDVDEGDDNVSIDDSDNGYPFRLRR